MSNLLPPSPFKEKNGGRGEEEGKEESGGKIDGKIITTYHWKQHRTQEFLPRNASWG